MIYLLQKFLIFSIPLREMAGFERGVPLRVGELLMLIYALYVFLKTSMEKKLVFFKRTKLSKTIVYLLGLNLILTFLFSKGQPISTSFFYRYLLRNIMVLFFFIAVLIKPLKIRKKDLELFFKYMILLQFFMLILQKLGLTIKLFSLVSYPMGRRFQGTASEAGYLPTLIVTALWYFRNSIRNKKYYYLGIFEIFMTFSSFGYAVLAIELCISLFTKKIKVNPKRFLNTAVIGFFLLVVIGLNFKIVSNAVEKNFTKIVKYSKNDGGDFSSRARNQQLDFIKKEIDGFNKEELLFGKGTGSYAYTQFKQIKKHKLLEITEEAHTVYYSTIHDRGILGFMATIGIFLIFLYMFYKQRKNKIVMCFAYLYLFQMIHWKITANMWLYYFWISMAYVVSQYEIKEIRKRRRDRRKNGLNKYNNAYLQKAGFIQ